MVDFCEIIVASAVNVRIINNNQKMVHITPMSSPPKYFMLKHKLCVINDPDKAHNNLRHCNIKYIAKLSNKQFYDTPLAVTKIYAVLVYRNVVFTHVQHP